MNVIKGHASHPQLAELERIREELLDDDREIVLQDFGAGSRRNQKNPTVSRIAKNSLKPTRQAMLLYRLTNYFQPRQILELGTSMGLTSAYLALASPRAEMTTMEGSPSLLEIAQNNWKRLDIPHINAIQGNIDDLLPAYLEDKKSLDFAFFDANHRYEATMNYFHQCAALTNHRSVFIIDDIHWSGEMEEAWREIKADPRVYVTVDLFFVGLVFFHKNQAEEHFRLRF